MTAPRRLVRYVLTQYLRVFAPTLAALAGAYLVIDFVDRAHLYAGPHPLGDVALLYACNALTVTHQLAPAAMLLAGGICASALRRRNELVAMGALAVGPGVLAAGVIGGAVLIGAGMALVEEVPVRAASPQSLLGWAGAEADELMATHFWQWGDFAEYFGPRHWFRGAGRIYLLRNPDGAGFADVSIFQLGPDFRLAARIDAARMQPLPDGRWQLEDGQERTFAGDGGSELHRFASRVERFPEDPASFRLRPGRPRQLTHAELASEVALRERLGLPMPGYRYALHEKWIEPLLGIPAALLAAALALRRKRRGHLTGALVEGAALVGVLGAVMALSRALAEADALPVALAAGLPLVLLTIASAAGWALATRRA